jgi:hypothetical protein
MTEGNDFSLGFALANCFLGADPDQKVELCTADCFQTEDEWTRYRYYWRVGCCDQLCCGLIVSTGCLPLRCDCRKRTAREVYQLESLWNEIDGSDLEDGSDELDY